MEDLTVNTQQADFVNQQQQAGMANTMDNLYKAQPEDPVLRP